MAKLTSIFKMIGAQSARLKTPNEAIEYIFNQKTALVYVVTNIRP